jgi:type IV pilus assembly protein PilY1
VISVGAHDGMLHAFDGSDSSDGGKELFSYIPNAVLGKLQELARPGYMHRYYVDGSPTVGDAYLASAWKTVLLGSVGAGGRGVFALDVTSPANFSKDKVLWEFNSSDDARMGQFVGRPNMGIAENGQWLAVFGNGYNSVDNRAVLFIRDLRTGAEVATIDTNVGCTAGTDNCTVGPNGLATALLVDNDGNGAGDTIYAGDYLGNLWRFEYTGNAWKLGNGNKPLFTAKDPGGKPQSITSGVFTTANPLGGTMVVFGTGRYLNVEDADSSKIGEGTRASVDSIYGIWDTRWFDVDSNTWTDSWPIQSRSVLGGYADLGQQKITKYVPLAADGSGGYREATRNSIDFKTSSSDANGKMGWYIDLDCSGCGLAAGATDPLRGERVTATPQGILGDVVFNVLRPEGDACEPGSQNAALVFDALIGAAGYVPVNPTFGGSGHGPLLGVDTYRGPPPGEPPIVIIAQPTKPVGGLPCDPADPSCTPPCDPATDPSCTAPEEIKGCNWFSPNAAGKPAGKPVPCGRVSWRQLR